MAYRNNEPYNDLPLLPPRAALETTRHGLRLSAGVGTNRRSAAGKTRARSALPTSGALGGTQGMKL